LPAFEDVLEAVPKKSWQNTLTAEEKVIEEKLYEKVLDLKNAGGQTMCGTEVAALFLKHRIQPDVEETSNVVVHWLQGCNTYQ
jgi:leucyl aminopeptidase